MAKWEQPEITELQLEVEQQHVCFREMVMQFEDQTTELTTWRSQVHTN